MEIGDQNEGGGGGNTGRERQRVEVVRKGSAVDTVVADE